MNSGKRNDKTSTANLQIKELDGEKAVLYPVNYHMLHANCKRVYTDDIEINLIYNEVFNARFLYER